MGAHLDAVAPRDAENRAAAEWLVGAARGELLERLSGGFVHEARNPLNAVAIHLEVLADKLRDPETGEIPANFSRNVEAARNQVRRLDELLREYGEFAGRQPPANDLASLLKRAASLCEYHVRRAGLSLAVEAQQGVALQEPDALCHAILELLHLAICRAAPGSGLELSAHAGAGGIEIALAGAGDEANGAPGLAVEAARAIVHSLGGEIELDAGASWCWRLRLPVATTVGAAVK